MAQNRDSRTIETNKNLAATPSRPSAPLSPSEKGNSKGAFPSSVEMGPDAFNRWMNQQIEANLKNPARHYPEEDQEPKPGAVVRARNGGAALES